MRYDYSRCKNARKLNNYNDLQHIGKNISQQMWTKMMNKKSVESKIWHRNVYNKKTRITVINKKKEKYTIKPNLIKIRIQNIT
jgi:hypothetical protein